MSSAGPINDRPGAAGPIGVDLVTGWVIGGRYDGPGDKVGT